MIRLKSLILAAVLVPILGIAGNLQAAVTSYTASLLTQLGTLGAPASTPDSSYEYSYIQGPVLNLIQTIEATHAGKFLPALGNSGVGPGHWSVVANPISSTGTQSFAQMLNVSASEFPNMGVTAYLLNGPLTGSSPNNDSLFAQFFPNAPPASSITNPSLLFGTTKTTDIGTFVSTNLPSSSWFTLGVISKGGSQPNVSSPVYWSDAALNAAGTSYVRIAEVSGPSALPGHYYFVVGFNDFAITGSNANFHGAMALFDIVPMPEPGTYLLLASMLGVCLFCMRKKALLSK
jgi:hypothetical protein